MRVPRIRKLQRLLIGEEVESAHISSSSIGKEPLAPGLPISLPWGFAPSVFVATHNRRICVANDIWSLLETRDHHILNVKYLKHFLKNGPSPGFETAFSGVYQLPPGAQLNGKGYLGGIAAPSPSTVWLQKPEASVIDSLVEEIASQIRAYRSVNRVAVLLSGGLDSTLVLLAAVRATEMPIIAVNVYFDECPTTDERRYAEIAAGLCHVELAFVKVEPTDFIFDELPSGFRPPLPARELLFTRVWDEIRKTIGGLNKTLFLSGHGGDQLFTIPPSRFFKGSYEDLLMACANHGLSIWQAIASYIGERLKYSISPYLPRIHRTDDIYRRWLINSISQTSIPSRHAILVTLCALSWRERAHDLAIGQVVYPLLGAKVVENIIGYIWSDCFGRVPRFHERTVLEFLGAPETIRLRRDKGLVAEPMLKCLALGKKPIADLCPRLISSGLCGPDELTGLERRASGWVVNVEEVWNALILERWLDSLPWKQLEIV